MKTYEIQATEGMKLIEDCSIWFCGNMGFVKIVWWIASRCNAPTLSANVKLEAAAVFLTTYFDIESGFDFTK